MKPTIALCFVVFFCLWSLWSGCEKEVVEEGKEELFDSLSSRRLWASVDSLLRIGIFPDSTGKYDLGDITKLWSNVYVYADTIRIGNEDCVVIGKHWWEQRMRDR